VKHQKLWRSVNGRPRLDGAEWPREYGGPIEDQTGAGQRNAPHQGAFAVAITGIWMLRLTLLKYGNGNAEA
jgi:hypothetical protein